MFEAALVESAPRAELFTYASRSATRCWSDGEAAAGGAASCAKAKSANSKTPAKIKARANMSIFPAPINRAALRKIDKETPPALWSARARRSPLSAQQLKLNEGIVDLLTDRVR